MSLAIWDHTVVVIDFNNNNIIIICIYICIYIAPQNPKIQTPSTRHKQIHTPPQPEADTRLYLPRRDGRLSVPTWLVTYTDACTADSVEENEPLRLRGMLYTYELFLKNLVVIMLMSECPYIDWMTATLRVVPWCRRLLGQQVRAHCMLCSRRRRQSNCGIMLQTRSRVWHAVGALRTNVPNQTRDRLVLKAQCHIPLWCIQVFIFFREQYVIGTP